MKTILIIFAGAALLSSCMSVKQIGQLNMVSTRNVSMKENYNLISSYAGAGKHDLKRNKAQTIDDAVNNLVRSTPGGEFIMNAKLYLLKRGKHLYFAVDGDVYGLGGVVRNFKGFKAGDRVYWKEYFNKYTGTIMDLKNDRECTVKQDGNGIIRHVNYSEISKIE